MQRLGLLDNLSQRGYMKLNKKISFRERIAINIPPVG